MSDTTDKPLICARRPTGVRKTSRLGQLVVRMDRVIVAYCVYIGTDGDHKLTGWGTLHVESDDGLVCCRVSGEVQRPSPFVLILHSFWLTRRGMIVLATNLLEERAPQTRAASESFIQPVPPFDRTAQLEAKKWLSKHP